MRPQPQKKSEKGARARRIFESAMEVSEEGRARLVDRACGDDAPLREAVERLLRADAEAGDFLREPLVRGAAASPFLPPPRIGPYQLQEKIGEGGMGVVYRGVRDDEAFQREVAVKLIVHQAMGKESRQRLGVERQILAGLDHPWIAQIFDGGTTEEGVPYMVMEYIDGKPIDVYCDQQGLPLRQRIELFRKVCSAVHCSHQNLVVHCDLKPSNILVTTAGEPKLLDFGIAKLLRQDIPEGEKGPGTVGSRPLTPEYASPEQFQGRALSTVSDVYSLGVLLHKLLTGQRPETQRELQPELRVDGNFFPTRTVDQEEGGLQGPADGSAPFSPHRLRGDLEAIVKKALRPRPEDRFSSVEQFSEDLRRHLQGFPVLAREGNLRYRAGKLLRRHRIPMAAAFASFAALAVFAFSMATLAGRLNEEREKLQEVVGFFRLFFERASPLVYEGRNLTLQEAVDQNAGLIETGLQNRPEVKVEIVTVLADIYRELGQSDLALIWSERALALNRQVVGKDSQAHSLSLVQVGAALRELGRFDDAERHTRAGLQQLQAQPDPEPQQLVHGLNNLVELLCYQERFQEADEPSRAAMELAQERLEENSAESLAATANRGQVLRRLGHATEALRLYEGALAPYRQRFGNAHPQVATVLLNLSSIYRERGDLTLAQHTLEEVNSQYLEIFGQDHYQRVMPLSGLASLARNQDRIGSALALYREAAEVAVASAAPPGYVLRPAMNFAQLLLSTDQCREGEQVLRDSLEYCRPHPDLGWRYAEVEGLLGECLVRQGSLAEARSLLEQSHARLRDSAEEGDSTALQRALQRLVGFYGAMGEEASRKQAEVALEAIGNIES
ncbi:MAG: serine/threonine-protein kinase [Deltaproteobacteria bacterium]|nr:serine/threonine-protein kinase [Deltaproteobacteria bacterium]